MLKPSSYMMLTFLRTVPGAVLYAPAYFQELREQLRLLAAEGEGICAIRYPRGKELYKPSYFVSSTKPFSIYGNLSSPICIITYGRLFSFAAEAIEGLAQKGISARLIKLNRIIPLDFAAVQEAAECGLVFFFEEGLRQGGIGEAFGCRLLETEFSGRFFLKAVENPFIEHAPMFRTLEELGLTAAGMMETVQDACRKEGISLGKEET